jgi:hypothetical protein
VERVLAAAGWDVRRYPFTTRWWEPGTAELIHHGEQVPVTPDPYRPNAEVTAPVVRLHDLAETIDAAGRIVLLDPTLTPGPLMPRAFPFFQPPGHTELLTHLEQARPAAVLAVGDGPPIIEDPDLPIASATVTTTAATRIREGDVVTLRTTGRVHTGAGHTSRPVTPRQVDAWSSAHTSTEGHDPRRLRQRRERRAGAGVGAARDTG